MKNKIKLVLIGMKACGKSTVGKILSQKLNIAFVELDAEIEKRHLFNTKEKQLCREIFNIRGKIYFRNLETEVLSDLSKILANKDYILSCGGGAPLKNQNRKILRHMGKIIFIDTKNNVLLERILKEGIPSFFPPDLDPEIALEQLLLKRLPVYKGLSDLCIPIDKDTPVEIADKICHLLNI